MAEAFSARREIAGRAGAGGGNPEGKKGAGATRNPEVVVVAVYVYFRLRKAAKMLARAAVRPSTVRRPLCLCAPHNRFATLSRADRRKAKRDKRKKKVVLPKLEVTLKKLFLKV